ncbi:MAG: toxin-antitoxin system YwqK family antitoxin [Planctomycetota bacterium]
MKHLLATTCITLALVGCGGGQRDGGEDMSPPMDDDGAPTSVGAVDGADGAADMADASQTGAAAPRPWDPLAREANTPIDNGKWSVDYADGQTAVSGSYADGVKVGTWVRHHPNGQKWEEAQYEDGKLVGTLKRWYANGEKELEAQYADGLKQGAYASWHDNGKPFEQGAYDADQRTGEWKFFHHNGQLLEVATWQRGTKRVDEINLADGTTIVDPVTGDPAQARGD